jgi:hypothetical protein
MIISLDHMGLQLNHDRQPHLEVEDHQRHGSLVDDFNIAETGFRPAILI